MSGPEQMPMDHDSAEEVRRLRSLVRYLAADDGVTALRLELNVEVDAAHPPDTKQGMRWGLVVTAPGFDEERLARALIPLMQEAITATLKTAVDESRAALAAATRDGEG